MVLGRGLGQPSSGTRGPPARGQRGGIISRGVPEDFDLIVLGSGMGGVSAAGQAAGAGLRVALVERGLLGGT